jgi:hypothetical protein
MKISPSELIQMFAAVQEATEQKFAGAEYRAVHTDNLKVVALVQAARNVRYVLSFFPAPGDFPAEPIGIPQDINVALERLRDMWKIAAEKNAELTGLRTQLAQAVEQIEKAIADLGISPRV